MAAWVTSRKQARRSTCATRGSREIYEGTNGIQAIDLVTRKLPLSGGQTVKAAIGRMRETVDKLTRQNAPGFGHSAGRLKSAVDSLERATDWMQAALPERPGEALAGATPYLKLFALAQGGTALAEKALAAQSSMEDAGQGDRSHAARVVTARFFAEHLATEAPALEREIVEGAGSIDGAGAVFAA